MLNILARLEQFSALVDKGFEIGIWKTRGIEKNWVAVTVR
jgi:hypothetical protein